MTSNALGSTAPAITQDTINHLLGAAGAVEAPWSKRWSCALLLAWNEGARLSEIEEAAEHDFDLTNGVWTRIRHKRFPESRIVPIAPTTRDAIAALSQLGPIEARSFIFGERHSMAPHWLRARGNQLGARALSFPSIAAAAKLRDFADVSMSDTDFYAKYPRVLADHHSRGVSRHVRGY